MRTQQSSNAVRRARGGNYAIIFALILMMILGFGALAIDIAYVRLSQAQVQDVADAASIAAVTILADTKDTAEATSVASGVIAANVVGDGPADLEQIEFGAWSDANGFVPGEVPPSAVRVTASRTDQNSIGLFLARLFNWDQFEVRAAAVAGVPATEVILVMDITNSWAPTDFMEARKAGLEFLRAFRGTHTPFDRIGMTVFTNRFGWEFVPFEYVEDVGIDIIADSFGGKDWDTVAGELTSAGCLDEPACEAFMNLRTASKTGQDGSHWPDYAEPTDNRKCPESGGMVDNDFSDPDNICYENMPREYSDEPGTDHTTGMYMAAAMLADMDGPTPGSGEYLEPDEVEAAIVAVNPGDVSRAIVILTDGRPNGWSGSMDDKTRTDEDFIEDRWREYRDPNDSHTFNDIQTDTVALADLLCRETGTITYTVSFVEDNAFLGDAASAGCGGTYYYTNDASALAGIFEEIFNSLPLVIRE